MLHGYTSNDLCLGVLLRKTNMEITFFSGLAYEVSFMVICYWLAAKCSCFLKIFELVLIVVSTYDNVFGFVLLYMEAKTKSVFSFQSII